MGENTNDLPVIDFSTSADWWASDLASVLSSLDELYNALALAKHLAKIEEEKLERSLNQAEENWFRFRKMGPDLDMFFHEWARFLRHAGPDALRFLPGFTWGVPMSPGPTLADTERELSSYFREPNAFLSQANRLTIVSIEMSSPGGFSLKGLGEPIKQLRELIKDLCYRNRQEQQKGELELLKEKLAIASQYKLSPQQVFVLATNAIEYQEHVKDVIEEGRLALAGEESNSPNSSPRTIRRRTRKIPPSNKSS
jgi:hypothetical protein